MVKKVKSHKDLLREAFLGKIKFYDASIVLPPLLEVDPTKRRYQETSRQCLVYWRFNNQLKGSPDNFSFATRYKTGWQIHGTTGHATILSWGYVPIKSLKP